jgi:hypothetical protein
MKCVVEMANADLMKYNKKSRQQGKGKIRDSEDTLSSSHLFQ